MHLCEMVDNRVLGGLFESRLAAEAGLEGDELLPRCKTFHKLFDVLRESSTRAPGPLVAIIAYRSSDSHFCRIAFPIASARDAIPASQGAGSVRVGRQPSGQDGTGSQELYHDVLVVSRLSLHRPRSLCQSSCSVISKPTLQSTNPPGRASHNHGPSHGGEIIVRIARVASQDDNCLYGTALDVQPAVFALEVDWRPEAGWLGVNPGTKTEVDKDVFEAVRIGSVVVS
jgi:hypothetical protein